MKIDKVLRGILPILFIISIVLALISFQTFNSLYGDAKVINFAGILRGGTQYLVNQELNNNYNDSIIGMLDSIIDEMKGLSGIYRIVAMKDPEFQEVLLNFEENWDNLISEVYNYRVEGDPQRLIQISTDNYIIANRMVLSAQHISEAKMEKILSLRRSLQIISIIILLVYLYQLFSFFHLKKNNKKLEEIAFIDSITKLPNRASFDQIIKKYKAMDKIPNLTCIYFDLNNLKVINDTFGHSEGDKLISMFGKILYANSKKYGFVCRNGGDEFIALFEDVNKRLIDRYMSTLNKMVEIYNNKEENIKISFAHGISSSLEPGMRNVNDLMTLADKRMYENKRKYKELQIKFITR